jgi:hypothetical protein
MPRQIRIICEDTLYEVVPRAKEGLPLPPNQTSNQLLAGILGRTQRDEKVTLCNFVEMNSHSHQHVIPNDPYKLTKFYMEYQKKITDSVRKLTKLKSLELWEDRPSVIKVVQLEDVIRRIIYLFLNPAKAGLVESIDQYPGLSSWQAFKTCEPSIDATYKIKAYWTPASVIEPLPTNNKLSPFEDQAMAKRLRAKKSTIEYDLVIQPFAWLKIYGITNPREIEAIRQRIITAVYAEESALAKKRQDEELSAIGAEKLKRQQYLRPHTPKKKERRIFVICADNELRPKIIANHRETARKHKKCSENLRNGIPQEWPPGTFIPWGPPKMFGSPVGH